MAGTRGGPLAPRLSLSVLRGVAGELGLFFGQQANENLPAGFVGFRGQQTAEMLDIEASHGSIQGALLG